MKKILYTLFITALFISCTDDEFIEGTSVGFFPTGAASALEEDGIASAFSLQAIGEVNGAGSATITLTNYEFIATTPAHTNGVIEVSFNNSKEAFLTVEALDDDFDYNYQAVFTVTSVSGALQGIANSRFTFNVEDDDVVAFFEDDFESGDISKWETVDIAGNSWGTGSFSGNTYADISNFNANGVTEGWLVSPEIDFSAILNPVLSFETQARFGGDLSPLSALILTNYTGDPAAATQQVLTYTPDPHEGAGFGDLTPSGEINLADVTGSARIAFHYAASDASDGSGWSVDNVLLNFFDPDNSDGIPNDQGGNGGGGGGGDCPDPITVASLSLPFSDDFESCATVGDFEIPTGWIEEAVPGFKTDRGWGCRGFGRNGSSAPACSAFGGEDGEDNSWLITNGKLDLTGVTSSTLVFWIASPFSGPGELKVHWSSDYAGVGDPECATWNELTDVPGQLPAGASNVWTEITADLSGAAGNDIFIGFQYVGALSSSSVSYNVDDLLITGN